MSIFDKYLVHTFLKSETVTEAIPTATWSEDFAVSLGDFTTSGDVVWSRVTDEGNGDLFSAKSGAISDKQASTLTLTKTTTQSSTLLKYDYKTSTEESYDYLMVIVNDVIVKRYSGTNAWTSDSVFIHGIGSQTIKFVYWKDNSGNGGSLDTVWVDNVSLHNYEESGISNTSTLFKEDVTINGDFVQKNGEASFNEINLTGRFNAFDSTNKRFLAIRPSGTGGNITMWNSIGVQGYNQSLSSTSMGITLSNPTTGDGKVIFGASASLPEGFLQMPSTTSQLRLGEFAGNDTDKILVANGESIFRGQIDIDDGTGVGGNTNLISFATDRAWIGYNAGNLRVQASGGKGISWQTDTTGFGTAGSEMYLFQGQLGIGTNSPETKLDIRPDAAWIKCALNFTSDTQNPTIKLYRPTGAGTTTYNWHIRGGGSSSSNLEFASGSAAENGAETVTAKMVINSLGNVGIGTTDPDGLLHIDGISDSKSGLVLEASNSGDNRSIDFHNTVGALRLGVEYDNSNINLNVVNRSREKLLTVRESGNVGIGTTNPSEKLHVYNGSAYITPIAYASWQDDWVVKTGAYNNTAFDQGLKLKSTSTGASYMAFDTVGNINTLTLRSGNVGIGQIDPNSIFQIYNDTTAATTVNSYKRQTSNSWSCGTGNTLYINEYSLRNANGSDWTSMNVHNAIDIDGVYGVPGTSTKTFWERDPQSGKHYFGNQSNYTMAIDGLNNRVGIGITNPGYKLDVNGTGRFTDTLTLEENDATVTGQAKVHQLGTGDAGVLFSVTAQSFIVGIDNSDADKFKICSGSSIGTADRLSISPTGEAVFNSTVTAGNFILDSDERLKDKIRSVDYDKHINVDWKTFELKTEKGQKRYGVIAQELEKTNPEFVRTNDEGMKSVAYIDLLIAKIAELEARLEKAGI